MDKNEFFSSIKLKSEKFTFSNGHVIELHELTPSSRDAVIPHFKNAEAPSLAQAHTIVYGSSYFTLEDVPRLLEKLSADELNAAAEVVMRLSGILKDDDSKKE